jgi:hypothetical protein
MQANGAAGVVSAAAKLQLATRYVSADKADDL